MKVVIDINEDYYEIIKHNVNNWHNDFKPYNIIANGTPLPKGHGRLIDADELKRTMEKDKRRALSFVDLTDFVWLAPTIIEADKGE